MAIWASVVDSGGVDAMALFQSQRIRRHRMEPSHRPDASSPDKRKRFALDYAPAYPGSEPALGYAHGLPCVRFHGKGVEFPVMPPNRKGPSPVTAAMVLFRKQQTPGKTGCCLGNRGKRGGMTALQNGK